jgi:hypothetical protein
MNGRQLNMLMKRAWEIEMRLGDMQNILLTCDYPELINVMPMPLGKIKEMQLLIKDILTQFNKLDK